MVRAIFTQRRKTLANALEAVRRPRRGIRRGPRRGGIDPRRRPETLELAEFGALAEAFGPSGRLSCAIVSARKSAICRPSGLFRRSARSDNELA